MKKYQSTKIVEAAQIVDITGVPVPHSGRLGSADQKITKLTVSLNGGHIVMDVPSDIGARYWPQIGDYLVRYADGYLSISPKKAFEEGYVEISP